MVEDTDCDISAVCTLFKSQGVGKVNLKHKEEKEKEISRGANCIAGTIRVT